MHPVIYLNKVMLEATKARVAPVSSAMLYGRGVFTTLAIYNGKPFLWSQHWNRLKDHAERLNIDCVGANKRRMVAHALSCWRGAAATFGEQKGKVRAKLIC